MMRVGGTAGLLVAMVIAHLVLARADGPDEGGGPGQQPPCLVNVRLGDPCPGLRPAGQPMVLVRGQLLPVLPE